MVRRRLGTIALEGVGASALGVDRSDVPEHLAAAVLMGDGYEAPGGFWLRVFGRQSPDCRRC